VRCARERVDGWFVGRHQVEVGFARGDGREELGERDDFALPVDGRGDAARGLKGRLDFGRDRRLGRVDHGLDLFGVGAFRFGLFKFPLALFLGQTPSFGLGFRARLGFDAALLCFI